MQSSILIAVIVTFLKHKSQRLEEIFYLSFSTVLFKIGKLYCFLMHFRTSDSHCQKLNKLSRTLKQTAQDKMFVIDVTTLIITF